ncbi:hypothetical protein Zmor_012599 [Zophobas morio]|uniref:Uncharacterized protein n=1 Tax=Zophobas morio TaxID=2755281 RepID=A0AA38IBQ9_9CUCU|nr:hypothetical protein Zmor_012599 [Zophobas morio]
MRVYRDDGTWYTPHLDDDAFGWNFNDINIHEDVYSDMKFSVENPQSVDLPGERKRLTTQDIDMQTPRKSQIINLINPCTFESRALLSVVNQSLLTTLDPSMIRTDHFVQSSAYKMYTGDSDGLIVEEIDNYNRCKNHNFSLLMDMVLSENKCDVKAISFDKYGESNGDEVDSGNNFRSEWDNRKMQRVYSLNHDCDMISDQIVKLSSETRVSLKTMSELRAVFEEENKRVDQLIQDAQYIGKELRETKFLDDLTHLLTGQLEKVVLKEASFRIFLRPDEDEEMNLII